MAQRPFLARLGLKTDGYVHADTAVQAGLAALPAAPVEMDYTAASLLYKIGSGITAANAAGVGSLCIGVAISSFSPSAGTPNVLIGRSIGTTGDYANTLLVGMGMTLGAADHVNAIIIGNGGTFTGNASNAVIVGSPTATGARCVGLGAGTTLGTDGVGLGYTAVASGTGAIALGATSLAGFNYAIAIGYGAVCASNNQIVLGRTTEFVSIPGTGVTNSTVTGALRVAGGVGVGGALYVGGVINATTSVTSSWTGLTVRNTSNNASAQTAAVVANDNGRGISLISTSTTATGTRFGLAKADQAQILGSGATMAIGLPDINGAIAIGSAGVAVATFGGGTLGTHNLTVHYTTASTSTTTGSLVVSGGMGVAGASYLGGALTMISPGPHEKAVLTAGGQLKLQPSSTGSIVISGDSALQVEWSSATAGSASRGIEVSISNSGVDGAYGGRFITTVSNAAGDLYGTYSSVFTSTASRTDDLIAGYFIADEQSAGTSGIVYGVKTQATSTDVTTVYGVFSDCWGPGTIYGAKFSAYSDNEDVGVVLYGVYGVAEHDVAATAGTSYGGYFLSTQGAVAGDSYGVYAASTGGPGFVTAGYFGASATGAAAKVRGVLAASSGTTDTVSGGYNRAGHFEATNTSVQPSATATGVYAVADSPAGGTSYGIYAVASGAGTNWAGYFSGDSKVTGLLSLDSYLEGSAESVNASGNITKRKTRFTGNTAAQVLSLPAAVNGRDIYVRNAATVSVDIARSGADTIEGGAANLTLGVGESVLLSAIGTDWTTF